MHPVHGGGHATNATYATNSMYVTNATYATYAIYATYQDRGKRVLQTHSSGPLQQNHGDQQQHSHQAENHRDHIWEQNQGDIYTVFTLYIEKYIYT